MTGSISTVGGRNPSDVKWDTDVPESLEVARHAFEKATATGAVAFDTSSTAGGITLDPAKGFSTDVKSVTFIAHMAGG